MPLRADTDLKTLVAGALALALGVSDGRAMQQTPTFRARVDLLTIEVTVLGDGGVPVSGLKPDEFLVKVDGKRAEVETVDYQEFGSAPGVDPRAAIPRHPEALPGAESRITPSSGAGGRVIMVVIDDLSAKPGENAGLRVAAERILGSVGPSDLIGLVTTSGLGPMVQPTTVREPFLAALREKSIVGRSIVNSDPYYITTKEALDIEAGDRTVRRGVITREGDVELTVFRMAREIRRRAAQQVAAIRSVIDALRSAPMPRVMIVLTRGLAFPNDAIGEDLEALRRAASEARVQFFAVTDADDDSEITRQRSRCNPPGCADPVRAAGDEYRFLNDGMKNVANATGGEAWAVVGQADRFLTRILTETASLYRLGVRVPANVRADRYLKLDVETTRRGLTTRVRPYAVHDEIEEATKPAKEIEARLNDRLAQGGASLGVPIALATVIRGDPRGPIWLVGLSVRVPAVVQGPLTARFAVIDASGRVEVAGQRTLDDTAPAVPYGMNLQVPIKSGSEARRLRLAIADGRGNIGGLEQPLVAKFRQFDSLAVSELLFSWVRSDDAPRFLAFETVPDRATELWCSIELYPLSPPPAGLRVRFTVSGSGQAPTFEGEVAPETYDANRTATVKIPVARLPSGEFTVQATILDGDIVLGSQSSVRRR